jgi:hypothetical protein
MTAINRYTVNIYNIKQSNVSPIACHKTISYNTFIVQHHHIKTNIINLISSKPWLWHVGECRCKDLVIMSPPACAAARSHPPLMLPHVPKDQRLALWSMALWEDLHGKEPMPQPSFSHLLSMMTIFQRTKLIHSRIIRSDRGGVLNLSMCNRASSTSTGELLYSIMRIPKMFVASSCLLFAACSMCWSPSAPEPSS